MIQKDRRIGYFIFLAIFIAGYIPLAWFVKDDEELLPLIYFIAAIIVILSVLVLRFELKCRKIESIYSYRRKCPLGTGFIYSKNSLYCPKESVLLTDSRTRNRLYSFRKQVRSAQRKLTSLNDSKAKTPEAYAYIIDNVGVDPLSSYDNLCMAVNALKKVDSYHKRYNVVKDICENNIDAACYVMQKYGIEPNNKRVDGVSFQKEFFELYPHVSEIKVAQRRIQSLKTDIYSVKDKDILIWFLKEYHSGAWNELSESQLQSLSSSDIISAVSAAGTRLNYKSAADRLRLDNVYGYDVYEANHGKIDVYVPIEPEVQSKIIEYENEYREKVKTLDSLNESCKLAFEFYCSQNNVNWSKDRSNWLSIYKLFPLSIKISEYQKDIEEIRQLRSLYPDSFTEYFPTSDNPSSPKHAKFILGKKDSLRIRQHELNNQRQEAVEIRRKYPIAVEYYFKKYPYLRTSKYQDSLLIEEKGEICKIHDTYLSLKAEAMPIVSQYQVEINQIFDHFSAEDIDCLKQLLSKKDVVFALHRENQEKKRVADKVSAIKKLYPDGVRVFTIGNALCSDSDIVSKEKAICEYDKLFKRCSSYSGTDFNDFLDSISIQVKEPSEWSISDIETIGKHINEFLAFPVDLDNANRIISLYPDAFLKLFSTYTASYSEVRSLISQENKLASMQFQIRKTSEWTKVAKQYPDGVRIFKSEHFDTFATSLPNDDIIQQVRSSDELYKEVYRLFYFKKAGFQQLYHYDENQLMSFSDSDLRHILQSKDRIELLDERIRQEIRDKEDYLRSIRNKYPQGYDRFCRREGLDIYGHESYAVVTYNLAEISRLQDIYNQEIIEKKAREAEKRHMDELCSVRKPDAEMIKAYLNRKLIGRNCLYHFTAKSNIPSIKKNGGLYSWYYCQSHGIAISRPGGDDLSHQLDLYHGLEDYVRLSFCQDHPMSYSMRQEGIEVVLLEISPEVALFKSTLFSDMNATSNDESHGPSYSDLLKVNFNAVYTSYLTKDHPLFGLHQAEVMVKTWIPARYILNLDTI